MKKIINGFTNEREPIWRWETAEERLLEELDKVEQDKKKYRFNPNFTDFSENI